MTRKIVILLTLLGSTMLFAEELSVAVIRVSFQTDTSPATTGDGSFVMEDTTGLACDQWSLDPPPHDRQYFEDHLLAADNYWRKVSGGVVGIDTSRSGVVPIQAESSYLLPENMLYYHPYLESFDETEKLMELAQDALQLADPDIDFNEYSTVIIAHAGMGGDFAFALDPTPGNIPSAYLSEQDFMNYGQLSTDEGPLHDLIIIPESQNFLQFKETRTLFEEAEDPCFYQVGLNGTLALMFGFHLGLPPLYNTETGVSLVGGFALMDQGSNNFHGIVPAYPDPNTRHQMGWTEFQEARIGDTITLTGDAAPIRVAISESEYFLIENRQRNLITDSPYETWIDEPGFDTVSVLLSPSGVVLDVDEQHAGLPGNGLNIWHVDDNARHTSENPNGGDTQWVDFEEADGAQDMGHTAQLLFADYLETGWWFDPWFAGNEGYFHLNRHVVAGEDSLLQFGPDTRPSTRSNQGEDSHLWIADISRNGTAMTFEVRSNRQVDLSGLGMILGFDGDGSGFWALNADSSHLGRYRYLDGGLIMDSVSPVLPSFVLNEPAAASLQFRHPWLVRNIENGTMFKRITDGHEVPQFGKYDVFEVSVEAFNTMYFARADDGFVFGNWNTVLGATVFSPLFSTPSARFRTTQGIGIEYDALQTNPIPVAVSMRDDTVPAGMPPETLDIISWSSTHEKLRLLTVPDSLETLIDVEKPLDMIPLDAEGDGIYEIALFYEGQVRVINQAEISLSGNPFEIEPYYGNPLIAGFTSDEPQILLRHIDHYTIYALDGEKVESGVLPQATHGIEQRLSFEDDELMVFSGHNLLVFNAASLEPDQVFWSDPQGNAEGTRIVSLTGEPGVNTPSIEKGSVYNYPNPVKNGRTTIRAWIGDEDTWIIEIFSLSGAQVAYEELTVMQTNAYNEFEWNTSELSNGLFLAKISAGDKSEIIKIAIIP